MSVSTFVVKAQSLSADKRMFFYNQKFLAGLKIPITLPIWPLVGQQEGKNIYDLDAFSIQRSQLLWSILVP